MNDYISKPIESRQIFTALSRWIDKDKPENTKISSTISFDAPDSRGNDNTGIPLPDSLPGIDIKAGLTRINGNRNLYVSLLREFKAEHGETIDKIKKALSHDNPEYAASLIHAVKGASGNIGANKAFHSAKALETGIRMDRRPSENLMKKFETDLAEVLASTTVIQEIALSGSSDTDQVESSGPLNIPELSFMLSKLKKLLEKNSFSAETYLHSILKHLDAESRIKARRLMNHVNNLEYSHAQTELVSFAETMNIPLENG
jgi:polar amino acid transport system substrate-binding protein